MQLISFLCVVVATFSLTECLPVDGKMRGASQLCHSIAQSYKDQVICEKFFMEDTKVAAVSKRGTPLYFGNRGDEKSYIRFGRKRRSVQSMKRSGYVRVGRTQIGKESSSFEEEDVCQHTIRLLRGLINVKLQRLGQSHTKPGKPQDDDIMASMLQEAQHASGAESKRNGGYVRVGRSLSSCQQMVVELLLQLIDVETQIRSFDSGTIHVEDTPASGSM